MAMIRALVDKSALGRAAVPAVGEILNPMIDAGELAICTITIMETLYSSRSGKEWNETFSRLQSMPPVAITEQICQRAIEVQGRLWNTGKVRAAGIADLLVAAAA